MQKRESRCTSWGTRQKQSFWTNLRISKQNSLSSASLRSPAEPQTSFPKCTFLFSFISNPQFLIGSKLLRIWKCIWIRFMVGNNQLSFHGEGKATNSCFYFFMVSPWFCGVKFILVCYPNSLWMCFVVCGCSKVVRLSIARVLTVISQKQKAALREAYKKKKYLPLDLRPKKTRAIRRRLTKHQVPFIPYSSNLLLFILFLFYCIFCSLCYDFVVSSSYLYFYWVLK